MTVRDDQVFPPKKQDSRALIFRSHVSNSLLNAKRYASEGDGDPVPGSPQQYGC